jgi:hypothetical protein
MMGYWVAFATRNVVFTSLRYQVDAQLFVGLISPHFHTSHSTPRCSSYRLIEIMSGLLNTVASSLLSSSNLPSNTALAACAAISASTKVLIETWPMNQYTSQYQTAQSHYWSNANTDNTPACVVLPQNAQEVSEIVKVLLEYPDVGFAVKSGGHNANFGFSSTTGVLISMSNINSTTISSGRKTAVISPGATWAQTVTALEPFGVSVVGGRVGKSTNIKM